MEWLDESRDHYRKQGFIHIKSTRPKICATTYSTVSAIKEFVLHFLVLDNLICQKHIYWVSLTFPLISLSSAPAHGVNAVKLPNSLKSGYSSTSCINTCIQILAVCVIWCPWLTQLSSSQKSDTWNMQLQQLLNSSRTRTAQVQQSTTEITMKQPRIQ